MGPMRCLTPRRISRWPRCRNGSSSGSATCGPGTRPALPRKNLLPWDPQNPHPCLTSTAAFYSRAMRQMARPVLALVAVLLAAPVDSHAQAEYFGPTPYVGKADSPFDTSAFGFCVEDFENNKFDVPAITSALDHSPRKSP